MDESEDVRRPLSKRGRRQVRALARFLTRAAVDLPGEFWHSSLARSQETAVLLGRRAGSGASFVTMESLESGAGVAVLAAQLQQARRPVALVGHEPHLGALASLLVAGAAEPARFVLKKCAVVALERTGRRWQVRWQVAPELFLPEAGDADG